jgi:hypothetical protein
MLPELKKMNLANLSSSLLIEYSSHSFFHENNLKLIVFLSKPVVVSGSDFLHA